MATADYRCLGCGTIRLVILPQPEVISMLCGCDTEVDVHGDSCHRSVEHKRVWGPVAIGQVPGAGGSPPR